MSIPPLTLLVITPVSGRAAPELTPYSARGLTQTLEQINGNSVMGVQIRRDVNGGLMDLTYKQFQKYNSVITCRDQEPPVFDDAWFGAVVDVQCTAELKYRTGVGTPQRPVVTGSSRTQGEWTYYRPELLMMVTGIRNSFGEWESNYSWSIDLAEM